MRKQPSFHSVSGISLSRGGVLALLVFCTALLSILQSGANAQITGNAPSKPMRLQVSVTPAKNQRNVKGFYEDDKTQRISLNIDLKNPENVRALTGGKATILVFASDVRDPNEFIVILKEEFEVTLAPFKSTSYETKSAKLVFDDDGYRYGQKYAGYVLVIKDASGSIILIDGKPSFAEKNTENALKLTVDDVFDKEFTFVKKGYLRQS